MKLPIESGEAITVGTHCQCLDISSNCSYRNNAPSQLVRDSQGNVFAPLKPWRTLSAKFQSPPLKLGKESPPVKLGKQSHDMLSKAHLCKVSHRQARLLWLMLHDTLLLCITRLSSCLCGSLRPCDSARGCWPQMLYTALTDALEGSSALEQALQLKG